MKYRTFAVALVARTVAPLVGAWIEIQVTKSDIIGGYVAPLVGAWIEIICTGIGWQQTFVAPLVGAWIEILKLRWEIEFLMSLLSWERGLKYELVRLMSACFSRSSRGSVD